MLTAENRPRALSWFHAGPLLFGDWGTSRLYVIGLAFYYTGHASVWYLLAMSVIMAIVAWGYTVVCRCFPDGGGVYTAARRISPTLSVVGATLLLCDYAVTASLSVVEGFHYIGLPRELVVMVSIATIGVIGVINWLGARWSGRFALLIAIAAVATSAMIGLLCLPMLPSGLKTVRFHVDGVTSPFARWESLVRIVLALSGVEAVANMTGLMKKPVAKTSKRTIWPVLIEVVLLNMIFGIALNAMPARASTHVPDYVTQEIRAHVAPEDVPLEIREYRDTAVKMLAEHSAGSMFGEGAGRAIGVVAGVVFGLLLLSAVNTAIMAMVSVKYSLAQDGELPKQLARLNYSGVPWIGLIVAVTLPSVILLVVSDAKALGEMYAIGVVGAIMINFLSCAANKELPISRRERAGLWSMGVFMLIVELTIIVAKPKATLFAGLMVAIVLGARFVARSLKPKEGVPVEAPRDGWLAAIKAPPAKMPADAPRIMLAARGQEQAEFAVDLAKKRGGVLFAIYVRTMRLIDVAPGQLPRVESDPQAQKSLGTVAVLAQQARVPFVPIYVVSPTVAEEILDYTVTYGCDTLIMGKSQRTLFARRVSGDVVAKVAETLPDEVSLVLRATKLMAHEVQSAPVHATHSASTPAASETNEDDVGHA